MEKSKSHQTLGLLPKISPRSTSLGFTNFHTFENPNKSPALLSPNKTPNRNFQSTFPPITIREDLVTRDISRQIFLKTRERRESGSMQAYKGPIGPDARLDYFDSFKNLPKVTQRNKFEKLEDSPNVAYLQRVEQNQLQPKPFGMVRRNGPENNLDIHCYSMGDLYAEAFSDGLEHVKGLEKINLKSNRLTERGSFSILSKLPAQKLKSISLADNKIGTRSISKIIEMLTGFNSPLRHLNLENTSITDLAVSELCQVLADNKTLSRLSLARNNLTDKSAAALHDLLKYSQSLKRLDLHWNKIRGDGAKLFFEGLAGNDVLKVLDLSWNAIGRNDNLEVATLIGQSLKGHQTLYHLDLSYNYFTTEECKIIGDFLNENHVILGLHVAGNDCSLNSKGFITPQVAGERLEQGHFFRRIIETPKCNSYKESINCWVCENWIEVEFHWKPNVSGKADSDPIFLHLECDNYGADLMAKQHDGSYKLTRAVPPGLVKFFYSHNGSPMKSLEHKIIQLETPIQRQVQFWSGFTETVKMHSINVFPAKGPICHKNHNFDVKPRIPGLVYLPPEQELERIPWSIPISLFKDYKFDDENLLNDCFEFDWRYSRLPNFVKNQGDQDKVKEILRSHYKYIRETYKYLAAFSGSELFSIGSNVLTDFLNQCLILDSNYAVSDLGVNWNSCIVPKEKGMVYNPGSALVRYEFMEILVRVANDRYVRNKICTTVSESIQKLLDEHLMPVMINNDSNKWRFEKYICEEIDLVLKAHKPILNALFKKYSGKKTLPGQKVFMSLDEFRLLCSEAGLINDTFATREIDLCFTQAMMTQVDELYKKRHIEMSFVEFLEALVRSCDMANLNTNESLSEQEEIQQLFKTNNMSTNLRTKMESAFPNLCKICPQLVQDSFVFPTSETYKSMMYKSKSDNAQNSPSNIYLE